MNFKTPHLTLLSLPTICGLESTEKAKTHIAGSYRSPEIFCHKCCVISKNTDKFKKKNKKKKENLHILSAKPGTKLFVVAKQCLVCIWLSLITGGCIDFSQYLFYVFIRLPLPPLNLLWSYDWNGTVLLAETAHEFTARTVLAWLVDGGKGHTLLLLVFVPHRMWLAKRLRITSVKFNLRQKKLMVFHRCT